MSIAPLQGGRLYIVDDDPLFARLVAKLGESIGLEPAEFDRARAFLDAYDGAVPSCVVLDFCLPELNGLDALLELRRVAPDAPVIFVSGVADVPLAVAAMKLGASEFLQKPCTASVLAGAIQQAIAASLHIHGDRSRRREAQARLQALNPRQREVAELLAEGTDTKHVARALGLSAKTVEYHRTKAFKKLGVTNAVELAHFIHFGNG
jgi:FixJ family two-component response regulator